MSVYVPFNDQKKQDASFTIKAMGIQLGINLGTAIVVMIGFSLLRPRNKIVYSPKSKFMNEEYKPPPIESTGWFSWIKPVIKVSDKTLITQIGCDAVLYIRFVRLLRRLLLCMSIVGVGALIPIYIVATKSTGDWPPAPGSIEILSISGVNYQDGKLRADPNTQWYWAPFSATWIFSILIAYFMYRASCDYIDMRQYYFRMPKNDASMKSLIVSKIPKDKQDDIKLKSWMESTKAIQYPITDSMIGHHDSKLSTLFEEHELAVHQLETSLAAYLSDGKNTDKKKRPTVRVGRAFFGIFGGKKVDAIEHYTKEVSQKEQEIQKLRKKQNNMAPYGWISFDKIEYAHATERTLEKWLKKTNNNNAFHIRLSPTPQNLVWNNLPLDDKTRKAKRWIGRIIYWVFVFVWMIPMSALSATSNIVNVIRLIPNSASFIENHQVLMGLIQAYFTPIVMAIFFYFLPAFFRFLSQQQGYWTHTTLDRKVLTKLYVFFIFNNLLVFTLTSMLFGIYGQIRALVESGSLPADQSSISNYILQIAKNISEVSTFWINFVCLKSLGLTMDLAMLVPLITITIRKFITRPSPRELRELAKPPEFNFPQNYNLLLFFFTIALVYSAMSPLILPFALIYFCVASVVYKYMLMYVYVTKIESGGKIWPVLFQTVMTSVIFFQVTMIIILALKGGNLQAYILIPLPFLTLAFQYLYYRRMHVLGSYLIGSDSNLPSSYIDESFVGDKKKTKSTSKSSLRTQFQDPAYRDKLSKPTVHEDVKHLLNKVYHVPSQQQQQQHQRQDNRYNKKVNETFEMAQKFGKNVMHDMDLDQQQHGFGNKHRLVDVGCPFKFETVTENEILEYEDNDDKVDDLKNQPTRDYEDYDKLHKLNSYSSSNYAASSYYNNSDTAPLLGQIPPPLPTHNTQHFLHPQSRQPLTSERNVTSEYIEMYSSFTPNASALNVGQEELTEKNISLEEFGEPTRLSSSKSVADYQRRHTDPFVSSEKDYDEEDNTVRHNSLPNMYRPSLTTMDYLSDDDDKEIEEAVISQAIQLKRQISAPISHPRLQKESTALRRTKTMPYNSSLNSENPFDSREDYELTDSPIFEDNEKVLVEETVSCNMYNDDNEKVLIEGEEDAEDGGSSDINNQNRPTNYNRVLTEESFVEIGRAHV